jgi:hypothetical protein
MRIMVLNIRRYKQRRVGINMLRHTLKRLIRSHLNELMSMNSGTVKKKLDINQCKTSRAKEINCAKKKLGLEVLSILMQTTINKQWSYFARKLKEIYEIRKIHSSLVYKIILRHYFNYFHMKITTLMQYDKSLNLILRIYKKNVLQYYFNTMRIKVKHIKSLKLLRRIIKKYLIKCKQRYIYTLNVEHCLSLLK